MCTYKRSFIRAICFVVCAILLHFYIAQGNFFLVCKFCFEKANRLTTVRSNSSLLCPACSHEWTDLLVHVSRRTSQSVAIGRRRFTHRGAFYSLCYWQRFCRRRDTCVSAHSPTERDVWYLQRDHGYTWQQIVDEAQTQTVSDLHPWPYAVGAARRYAPRRWQFDSGKNRGGSTSVRRRVRSPHICGGRRWLSCRQPACL